MCSLLKGTQIVRADIEILDEAASPGVMTVETDVADVESVSAAVVRARHLGFGSPSVANAGVFAAEPFDSISASAWDRLHDVNLRGTFLTVQSALAQMTAGTVVTVGIYGRSGRWAAIPGLVVPRPRGA